MAKEKERITLYLSRHLKDRVEAAAKARRTSMNKLAISALRSRVDGILRRPPDVEDEQEERAAPTAGKSPGPPAPLHVGGETLREFCDRVSREGWRGTDTAFRAGAKARLAGSPVCNYTRSDFRDAWQRGWDAASDAVAESRRDPPE